MIDKIGSSSQVSFKSGETVIVNSGGAALSKVVDVLPFTRILEDADYTVFTFKKSSEAKSLLNQLKLNGIKSLSANVMLKRNQISIIEPLVKTMKKLKLFKSAE